MFLGSTPFSIKPPIMAPDMLPAPINAIVVIVVCTL
jgi:hypothetical protein